jgi:hypothetical protein
MSSRASGPAFIRIEGVRTLEIRAHKGLALTVLNKDLRMTAPTRGGKAWEGS